MMTVLTGGTLIDGTGRAPLDLTGEAAATLAGPGLLPRTSV